MSTFIPNANTWIGWSEDLPVDPDLVPTEAELAAALEMTEFFINLTASATGNTVPTPSLKSDFETTIPGTVTGQFTAEMYRDKIPALDIAWKTLPRGTHGCFYVSRAGGTGVDKIPVSGDEDVETWVVDVSARTPGALASNTAQTFNLTCSLPVAPNEGATIV